MKWSVWYAESARKDLSRFDRGNAQRIILKIRFFAKQENPLRFAKKLQSPFEDLYRFRIGEYRVIFEVDSNKEMHLLLILQIKQRKDAYV